MDVKLKRTVYTAVLSAMIFVLTTFLHVPVASGYVHFGDALLYICAILLGSPWAFLAGAVGEGLADVAGGFAAYAPATVIIKVLMVIPFVLLNKTQGAKKLFSKKAVMFSVLAGVIFVLGYFAADMVIARAYAFVDIPGNIIQSAGSAVIFVALALALDKAKILDKINIH